MNLSKSHDFFKPEEMTGRIHIVGCGSVGSVVAENLVRFGITKITLYDFDIVESKNIANQLFDAEDIGRPKVEALTDHLARINPDIRKDLRVQPNGYIDQKLTGYVFLCVDSIELRRKIAESCVGNTFVKGFFDFRTRLTDAQHYAADWCDRKMVEAFLNSMAFSHEEAKEATPTSACGVELSVCPTIRNIVAMGVSNFINFVKGRGLKKMIIFDAFDFDLVAL